MQARRRAADRESCVGISRVGSGASGRTIIGRAAWLRGARCRSIQKLPAWGSPGLIESPREQRIHSEFIAEEPGDGALGRNVIRAAWPCGESTGVLVAETVESSLTRRSRQPSPGGMLPCFLRFAPGHVPCLWSGCLSLDVRLKKNAGYQTASIGSGNSRTDRGRNCCDTIALRSSDRCSIRRSDRK